MPFARRLPPPSRLATLVLLAVFATLALARPAAAQITGTAGTTGTTTASLADGDIFIGVQQTEGANLAAFDLARFFNKANCDCKTPVFLYFTLTATGFAKRNLGLTGNLSFWIGSQCNDPILQKTNCQLIGAEQIATFMNLGRDTIMTTADAMSANTTVATTSIDDAGTTGITNGTTPNVDCTSATNGFNQTVWAIFDFGADGTFDFSATQAVFVDLTPPPAPTNIVVSPGNEALTVTWTDVDYSLNMDLQGYQVFCQRGRDLQVFANGTFGSIVKTCSATADGGVSATGGGSGFDGGVSVLDPLFACSPLLNRSVDAYRVKILQNAIPYGATVVAVDNSGNALTPTMQNIMFTHPTRTNSFFDVYRDGNQTNGAPGQTATPGKATGGLCAVSSGDTERGPWPLGVAAGAFVAAALARARRRRP